MNQSFGKSYETHNQANKILLWDKGGFFSGSRFIFIDYSQINDEELQIIFRAGVIAQTSLFLYNRISLDLDKGIFGNLPRKKTLNHFNNLLTFFEVDTNNNPIKHIKRKNTIPKLLLGGMIDYLLVIILIFIPLGLGTFLLIFGEFAFALFLLLIGSIFVIIYFRRIFLLKKQFLI